MRIQAYNTRIAPPKRTNLTQALKAAASSAGADNQRDGRSSHQEIPSRIYDIEEFKDHIVIVRETDKGRSLILEFGVEFVEFTKDDLNGHWVRQASQPALYKNGQPYYPTDELVSKESHYTPIVLVE